MSGLCDFLFGWFVILQAQHHQSLHFAEAISNQITTASQNIISKTTMHPLIIHHNHQLVNSNCWFSRPFFQLSPESAGR